MILRTARKYLFQQPTVFPWVMLILLFVMIVYSVIGIIVMLKTPEGIMALLVLPFLMPYLAALWLSDYLLRRRLKEQLGRIRSIEWAILLLFALVFGVRHSATTRIVTSHFSPVVVLVEAPHARGGPFPHLFGLFSSLEVDSTNIVVVNRRVASLSTGSVTARTRFGGKYRQVYYMQYGEGDSLACGKRRHAVQFIMLESDSIPHFVFGQKQYDSISAQVCSKLGE